MGQIITAIGAAVQSKISNAARRASTRNAISQESLGTYNYHSERRKTRVADALCAILPQDTKGTFPYQCAYYPDMQASVTVVDANQVPVDLGVVAWHDQLVGAGARIDYHVEYMNRDLSFGTSERHTDRDAAERQHTGDFDHVRQSISADRAHLARCWSTTLARLAPYDSGVIDLVVDLPSTLKVNDAVVLTASISAVNPDPYPDNNYAEDSEAIPGANMMISKRPAYDSGPFVPGGVVTYTVEYYNQASYMDATSVVVTDRLPSGVTFLSALNDDWNTVTPITPIVVGNELRFSLGTLPPGAGGQLLVQAQLEPDAVRQDGLEKRRSA